MKPKAAIAPISQYPIAPRTGLAFTVPAGQIIRVTDVDGEQVADLVCFGQEDIDEYLSSGRTIDYNEKLFLSIFALILQMEDNR